MATEHDHSSSTHDTAPPVSSAPALSGPAGAPALPVAALGSVLRSPQLAGRGNGPVRALALRQAQQIYGNRAMQRAYEALAARPAPRPVQRAGGPTAPEDEDKDVPSGYRPPTFPHGEGHVLPGTRGSDSDEGSESSPTPRPAYGAEGRRSASEGSASDTAPGAVYKPATRAVGTQEGSESEPEVEAPPNEAETQKGYDDYGGLPVLTGAEPGPTAEGTGQTPPPESANAQVSPPPEALVAPSAPPMTSQDVEELVEAFPPLASHTGVADYALYLKRTLVKDHGWSDQLWFSVVNRVIQTALALYFPKPGQISDLALRRHARAYRQARFYHTTGKGNMKSIQDEGLQTKYGGTGMGIGEYERWKSERRIHVASDRRVLTKEEAKGKPVMRPFLPPERTALHPFPWVKKENPVAENDYDTTKTRAALDAIEPQELVTDPDTRVYENGVETPPKAMTTGADIPPENILFGSNQGLLGPDSPESEKQDTILGIVAQHYEGPAPDPALLAEIHRLAVEKGYISD